MYEKEWYQWLRQQKGVHKSWVLIGILLRRQDIFNLAGYFWSKKILCGKVTQLNVEQFAQFQDFTELEFRLSLLTLAVR